MKKIVIKEINNEYNDWYYDNLKDDLENNFNNDIFLISNRDNAGINDDLYVALVNDIYEYSDYVLEVYYKNHYANFIIDILKPYKKVSLKQALSIMVLLKDNNIKRDDFIIKALNIIYSGDFCFTTLRGYSQSDWIVCCYNKKTVNYDFIQYIEACCFNTGLEIWISNELIDIDNIDIDNIESLCDGYYDYMVDYFLLSDKKEYLASLAGCDSNDIAYYEIKDVKTITTHKVIYNEVK